MASRTQTFQLAVPVSDQDHVIGPENAAATLLEYGDYECPYCAAAEPVIQSVRRAMARKLRFIFRNFPLVEVHPHALQAAAAAEAAGLQGRFWPMHDLLFQNQETLDESALLICAAMIELDLDQFSADMRSSSVLHRIRRDIEGGIQSGVEGTPTFFINELKYQGSLDYSSLLSALEAAIDIP